MAFNIRNAVIAMEQYGGHLSDQALFREIEETQNGIRASIESYTQAVELLDNYDIGKAKYGVSVESFMGIAVEDKSFLSKVGELIVKFFKSILKGVVKLKDLLVKFFKWLGNKSLSAKKGIESLLKNIKESYDYLKNTKKRRNPKTGSRELDLIFEEIDELLKINKLELTLGSNIYYQDTKNGDDYLSDSLPLRLVEFSSALSGYELTIRVKGLAATVSKLGMGSGTKNRIENTISEDSVKKMTQEFITSMTGTFTEEVPEYAGFYAEKEIIRPRHPFASVFAFKKPKNMDYFEDILEAGFSVLNRDSLPTDKKYGFALVSTSEGILINPDLRNNFTPELRGTAVISSLQELEHEIGKVLKVGEDGDWGLTKEDFNGFRESGKFMVSFLSDFIDTYVIRYGSFLMKTRNALLKDVEKWNDALSDHVYIIETLYAKADALENKTKPREVKKRSFGMRDREFGE